MQSKRHKRKHENNRQDNCKWHMLDI